MTKESFHEANNKHFNYETQQSLETVLQREYGSVRSFPTQDPVKVMNSVHVYIQVAYSAGPVLEMVETILSKHQLPRTKAVVLGSAGGVSTFLLTIHFSSVSLASPVLDLDRTDTVQAVLAQCRQCCHRVHCSN